MTFEFTYEDILNIVGKYVSVRTGDEWPNGEARNLSFVWTLTVPKGLDAQRVLSSTRLRVSLVEPASPSSSEQADR